MGDAGRGNPQEKGKGKARRVPYYIGSLSNPLLRLRSVSLLTWEDKERKKERKKEREKGDISENQNLIYDRYSLPNETKIKDKVSSIFFFLSVGWSLDCSMYLTNLCLLRSFMDIG